MRTLTKSTAKMWTLTKSTAKMWTFRILATTAYKVVCSCFFLNISKVVRGGPAYRPGDYAKSLEEVPKIYRLLGQAVFRRENVSCMLKNLCLAGKS